MLSGLQQLRLVLTQSMMMFIFERSDAHQARTKRGPISSIYGTSLDAQSMLWSRLTSLARLLRRGGLRDKRWEDERDQETIGGRRKTNHWRKEGRPTIRGRKEGRTEGMDKVEERTKGRVNQKHQERESSPDSSKSRSSHGFGDEGV